MTTRPGYCPKPLGISLKSLRSPSFRNLADALEDEHAKLQAKLGKALPVQSIQLVAKLEGNGREYLQATLIMDYDGNEYFLALPWYPLNPAANRQNQLAQEDFTPYEHRL